jgi:hypothetical protein
LLGGISIATVIRLEQSGRLMAVKLNAGSNGGMTYYRAAQVRALAGGDQ